MKKELIIFGIVLVISALVLSGCNERTGITSISDIIQNPSKYLGKNVTIRGYFNALIKLDIEEIDGEPFIDNGYKISDRSDNSINGIDINDIGDDLIFNKEYHWTGKIIQVVSRTFSGEESIFILKISNIQSI